MDGFTFFLPLTKADQEKRLVYARAAVEELDKSREIMDYVTAKPQFEIWSDGYAKATMGKSFGNIRAMHNPKHLAGKVAKIEYNDDAKAVDVCIKVLDPVDWAKVEEGGYTGLSIGGGYLKKWVDTATGGTRYTPRIQEISFVDSPCIPSARIMEMQKQDGTTEEVLLKGTPRTFAELIPPPSFGQVRKGMASQLAGGIGGELAGGSIGAAIGTATLGPGVGTLVGRVAGGQLGSMAGSALASGASAAPEAAGAVSRSVGKLHIAKMPKPRRMASFGKADGYHPASELRERFRQDLGAATDAYHPRRRRRIKLHKAMAPKGKGFRALRTGQRLPGIHYGSRHPSPPPSAPSAPATPGTAIMRQAARPKLPSAGFRRDAAAPSGMGSRSSPMPSFKKRWKGQVMDEELQKAGAYDVGASAGSSAAGPTGGEETSPTAMIGGGAAKRPLRNASTSSAAAAPLASPSIGGGVAPGGAPSMAAPTYMTKQLGGMAARAGVEMVRHLAHHVIPRYVGGAVGIAGAKAGYKGARKATAKLANRLIARNVRLGRGAKLTPRQKKVIVGTAIGGSLIGGATGLAIGHHAAHTATQHVDQRLSHRYGRPASPGGRAPWETHKSEVLGTKLRKRGIFDPNPPGIRKPGTFKSRPLFGKAAYEGSAEDEREDKRGARRMGVSLRAYERTDQDRREDRAGEKRLGKISVGRALLGAGATMVPGALVGGAVAAGHKFRKAPRHTLLHHVGGLGLFGPSYIGYRVGRAIGQKKPAVKQQADGDLNKAIGGSILRGALSAVESSAGRKIISTAGKAGRGAMGMASSVTGGVKAAGSSLGGAARRGAMSAVTSPMGTKAIKLGGRALKSPAAQAVSGGLGRAGRGASSFVGKHPYTSAAVVGTGLGMLARAIRPNSDKQEGGGGLEKNIASKVGRGLRRFAVGFAESQGYESKATRMARAQSAARSSPQVNWSGPRRGMAWPKGTFPKGKYPSKKQEAGGDLEKSLGTLFMRGASGAIRGAVGGVRAGARGVARGVVGGTKRFPKTALVGAVGAGYYAGRPARPSYDDPETMKQERQELIGRLAKNILLQDDNTVSQWRQARSDQWGPRPFWQAPQDTNDPKKTVMAGMPEQSYGEPTGSLLSNIFGKGENPYGELAKRGFPPTPTSGAAREKIRLTMHEFKHGKLKSFRADRPKSKMPKVQNRKQAIAIALSQARRMGKSGDGVVVAALADRLAKQRRHSDTADVAGGTIFAGGRSVFHSLRDAYRGSKTRAAIAQLSPKEHAQRITAAKARWKKEGHVDMEFHHKALEDWASKALLGRDKKLARVKEEAAHFWHQAATAHEAYDKMKPHVGKNASIIMKVPHSPGLVHNPDKIGPEHFTRFGEPKKTIYLMHPDEVDDWVAKHGKGVSKAAPPGLIEHFDQLNKALDLPADLVAA